MSLCGTIHCFTYHSMHNAVTQTFYYFTFDDFCSNNIFYQFQEKIMHFT